MTWRANGSQTPGPCRPVAAERRAAVGGCGQQPGALAADALAEEPLAHLVAAPQPQLVGRHRHARRRRGAGSPASRCRSARRRRRSGRAAPAARRRRGRRRRQSTSRSARVARARCSALLTDATLVSSSSATSVACQRSTSRRISTARCRGGRCCSAATNARRIVSRAAASSAGSPSAGSTRASGMGWTQVFSGRARTQDRLGRGRRPEVHRPGPALAAAEHVEAHVGGDAVQPRPQRRAALEAVDALPGPHHRLLHGVLGLEARAEHPVAVAGQLPAVGLELRADVDVG